MMGVGLNGRWCIAYTLARMEAAFVFSIERRQSSIALVH